MLDQLADFNLLRALRPMPALEPFPDDDLLRAFGEHYAPLPNLNQPTGASRIAVIDGGLEVSSPLFAPFATLTELSPNPPWPQGVRHGTAVTAACLYGDVLANGALYPPAFAVDHYRVHPAPAGGNVDAFWVLDQIEAVARRGTHKIINLSLGPNLSVEDDEEPHRWTATLDELAYEERILFVVAAGNNGEHDAATGLNRVRVPSDMVNGLGVGACDVPVPTAPWNRAPYSAVGPGRVGSAVQPAGLSFGGTVGQPFGGLTGSGDLMATHGTSLATPLVTHGLGRLAAQLGAKASPDVLRAFAIHFAEKHDAHDHDQHGYGRFPSDFDDALACDADSVTLLYEGSVGRGEVLAMRLPVPSQLAAGNYEIRWTLAAQSRTQPTEPTEYTASAIDFVFRPHAETFNYSKKDAKARKLNAQVHATDIASLLGQGFTPSTHPASRPMPSAQGDEADRRIGGKWETVRTGKITMRGSSLLRPRFDLSHLSREGGLLTRSVDDLPYALLISVRGPRRSGLYDAARTEFRVLSPVRLTTPVRV
jgi:hypothetical protein